MFFFFWGGGEYIFITRLSGKAGKGKSPMCDEVEESVHIIIKCYENKLYLY
jgi:hypothetical protein